MNTFIRSGKQGASKRLTFKDYGDWWLENCAKGNIADSTYQEYEAVLRIMSILYSALNHLPK
jgi:hypothetical protein